MQRGVSRPETCHSTRPSLIPFHHDSELHDWSPNFASSYLVSSGGYVGRQYTSENPTHDSTSSISLGCPKLSVALTTFGWECSNGRTSL